MPENSSAGTVNGTVDAAAAAEMHIYMSHHYQLTASDFIL